MNNWAYAVKAGRCAQPRCFRDAIVVERMNRGLHTV